MTTPTIGVGGAMGPDEEREHQRRIAEQLADDADIAVQAIEEKIAGMQASLKAKKAEAKQYRAEAKKGGAE